MDDFAGDLDYLNDIRDAQMFQRTPRRKFERLGHFEYYDDDEFVDRHVHSCEMITMLDRKKKQSETL